MTLSGGLSLFSTRLEQILFGVGGVSGIVVGWAVNELHDAFYWLFAFVAVDYVLGTFQASKNRTWCSRQGFKGLLKKFFILMIAVLAHGLAKIIGFHPLETCIIFAFSLTEFGSILENIEKAGYGGVIPQSIRKILDVMRKKEDEAIEQLEQCHKKIG